MRRRLGPTGRGRLGPVALILLSLSFLTIALARLGGPLPFSFAPDDESRAYVNRVVDGDTIQVQMRGRSYSVRYIGIDTPETVAPRRPVEPFGKAAAERNRALVEGKVVSLEKDVSETDRFGRLLRYVYVDGRMVNALLVEDGYARSSTYPPDVKHQGLFQRLEREAREARRGLWGQ